MTNITKTPTMAQIRKIADKRLTIWNDYCCSCYRADPDDGYTIEDLHGLVAVYDDTSAAEMADARRDLFERLSGVECEPCDRGNVNCDSECFT